VDDPYSSVENMLRWQISLARKSVSENQKRLSEVGEIYPLPKVKPGSNPHGLPDQWAFGTLTPHQVSLRGAMDKLQWAERKVDKAEVALSEGKLPDAIHWIIAANQSINSTLSFWHSGGAITMWRYIEKYRKAQTVKSRSNRTTIFLGYENYEKFSIAKLVRDLAEKTDQLGDYIPVKELWGELINLLVDKETEPIETWHEKDGLVVEFISRYEGVEEVRSSYKFTSFKAAVSKHRRKLT